MYLATFLVKEERDKIEYNVAVTYPLGKGDVQSH